MLNQSVRGNYKKTFSSEGGKHMTAVVEAMHQFIMYIL